MSKVDIIDTEILRRKTDLEGLQGSAIDIRATIEQFNKLDELYREEELESRDILECTYAEDKHFTGEWPIVYSFQQVEVYPFFTNDDNTCNPYFPITKIQDKTFRGISPLLAVPARVGAYQRQRSFAATEDIPRLPALTELQNFPDISSEPLSTGWPGPQQLGPPYCSGGGYDETQCLLDGGVWDSGQCTGISEGQCTISGGTWNSMGNLIPDPVWNGPDTAPALLRVVLNPWKADIQVIIADLCENDTNELDYWQDIVNDIDTVLAAIAVDAVFVRATGDADPAAWGQTQSFTGAVEAARARLETAADTGIPAHIAIRSAKLVVDAAAEEETFFKIVKLRLHQANGAYAKLKFTKELQTTNNEIITDHMEAIAFLNLLKVENS